MLLGDGMLLGDCLAQSNKAQINGDNSAGMSPLP